MKSIALMAVLAIASLGATAAPISATVLDDNVLTPGTVLPGDSFNPALATYFKFFTAGGLVSIDGSRVDGGYDMAFWLFSGSIDDTDHFGGGASTTDIDPSDPGFIVFADEEHPPAVPGSFGDPFFSGNLAAGWYTVAVVDVFSNGNTGNNQVYDYTLLATGITAAPEPATLALLGLAAVGVAVSHRRK
jgi:hypothetical protein